MFEKLLKTKFHLRFAFNPCIRYKAKILGNKQGVNTLKRDVPVVVSLTSYKERFSDLELSLYSLLTQTIKPDRIILWLSNELSMLDLPYSITKFIKNGLEIRFVEDIGSYTKIVYTLKEFQDSVIVTADDDVIYPRDWLGLLYHSYIVNPNDIQVHRAHRVGIKNGNISPYEKWKKHVKEESARFDNFLTGVGGVLYPPNCFREEVFRKDIYLKYSPTADDVWLWFMALISDRKIRVVKDHIKTLTCTNILRQLGIIKGKTLYRFNINGDNDKQIKKLLKIYKNNVIRKLLNND